jgi:lipid A 3-O-deacylase
LTKISKFFLFALMTGSLVAGSPKAAAQMQPGANTVGLATIAPASDGPVAEVRKAQSWEFGPILESGKGMGNRSSYYFASAGAQVGKILTPVLHAGIMTGQFEYGANIMPLWQAYTPSAGEQTFLYPCGTGTCSFVGPEGGGTYRGVSLTPVILRWNFLTRSKRFQPWFQGAGGLIYTTHKFPPDLEVPHGTPGGTSVFNFSPQGGFGVHYFTREKRSIDLGVNAVHISSASLGDRNPGVNALVQIELGYTFWK